MSAPTRPAQRPWLTRNLKVLSGVSLLQDAASELLYPVLPIFLTVTLGAPASVVGAVEGIAEGASSGTKLVAGVLSDRHPKRRLIGAGYGLAAIGKLVIALAVVWPVVLVGRVLDRLGKGMRGAPRDALLVADIDVAARGRAFGFHRAADTTGAVIGPLLGLAAYHLLDERIRPLLIIAVIPAVLSVALVAAVRDRPARAEVAPRRSVFRGAGDLPARYWRVAAVLVAFGIVNFPDALLLLRLHDIGFSLTAILLAYVGYNVVYAVASYPGGVLADRLPKHRVFGLGVVFFALTYLGLGLTHSHAAAWLLLIGYGLFTAFTDGVGKAWVSELVDGPQQGSAQGVAQGMSGLAVLLAGVWAGLAWGHDGHVPLLVSGAVGAVIALGLLVRTRSRA